MNEAMIEYLGGHKTAKTQMKVFLSNGVMLEGLIGSFDDKCIILNKCMIYHDKIVSMTPQR